MGDKMEGLTIWLMTKIQYDKLGNAKVLQSFAKPAQESPIKYGAKKKKETGQGKMQTKHSKKEGTLF